MGLEALVGMAVAAGKTIAGVGKAIGTVLGPAAKVGGTTGGATGGLASGGAPVLGTEAAQGLATLGKVAKATQAIKPALQVASVAGTTGTTVKNKIEQDAASKQMKKAARSQINRQQTALAQSAPRLNQRQTKRGKTAVGSSGAGRSSAAGGSGLV